MLKNLINCYESVFDLSLSRIFIISLNLTENRHHACMPTDEGRFYINYGIKICLGGWTWNIKIEIETSTLILPWSHVTYVNVCGKKFCLTKLERTQIRSQLVAIRKNFCLNKQTITCKKFNFDSNHFFSLRCRDVRKSLKGFELQKFLLSWKKEPKNLWMKFDAVESFKGLTKISGHSLK